MNKLILFFIGIMSMAGELYANDHTNAPWVVSGSLGMSSYPDVFRQDGQTPVGRFSLGYTLVSQSGISLGIEGGIQNGNTMRLALPKDDIDALGGIPIEVQVKPSLDLLAHVEMEPFYSPLYLWLNGGVSYRQMQADRDSVNDLSLFSPEFQIGLGYKINERAAITLNYQSIFGKKPLLTVYPDRETALLEHIPGVEAVMIGYTYHF